MGYSLHNAQKPAIITSFYDHKLASEHPLASERPLFCHYAPELGRWLSRDPIEEGGGINLFNFVGNNPTSWWDRLGLDAWLVSNGGGHSSVIFSDSRFSTNFTEYSFIPAGGAGWEKGNAITRGKLERTHPEKLSPDALHIPLTDEQTAMGIRFAEILRNFPPPYKAHANNCSHVARKILEAALRIKLKCDKSGSGDYPFILEPSELEDAVKDYLNCGP